MLRRRDLVIGGCGCGLAALLLRARTGKAQSAPGLQGCLLIAGDIAGLGLSSSDFGALSGPMTDTSGNPDLDRALGRALVRLAGTFGVNPGFAFFEDANAPNAYASPETLVEGTWGAVVFGKSLFTDQFRRYDDGGMSVLSIIAHEFGHICQFRLNLHDDLRGGEPTVRKIELHADYLAGWYLGLRKRENPQVSLWAAGDTFNRIGDTNFSDPQHHGTPEQRVAASQAGFDLALSGQGEIGAALEAGRAFVHAL